MRAVPDASVLVAGGLSPEPDEPAAAAVLIAATTHAHGARLYTRTADDLRHVGALVEIVKVGG